MNSKSHFTPYVTVHDIELCSQNTQQVCFIVLNVLVHIPEQVSKRVQVLLLWRRLHLEHLLTAPLWFLDYCNYAFPSTKPCTKCQDIRWSGWPQSFLNYVISKILQHSSLLSWPMANGNIMHAFPSTNPCTKCQDIRWSGWPQSFLRYVISKILHHSSLLSWPMAHGNIMLNPTASFMNFQ